MQKPVLVLSSLPMPTKVTPPTPSTAQPTWPKAIAQPALEFAPTALPLIAGSIPAGLRGTLYRNGPGRLQRGTQRVGHWFDGDGAVLAVQFHDGGAKGVYRYVRSAGYESEESAGTLLHNGYGTLPAEPLWQRWRRGFKNAANTSVLALPDQVLTLWEGGHPHGLDRETLETKGLTNLGGLKSNQPYSAHPKRDPETGDIYNFGVGVGLGGMLNVYRSSATGTIQQQNTIPLAGVPLIHDFVLAGPYLVFVIPPVSLDLLPAMFQLKSYSEALTWRPERGTQILVLDRHTLNLVSRGETDPWFQWHFSNGYGDDQGLVVVDVVRYEDFATNQFLKEVALGQTQTEAPAQLWRLHINPKTGQLEETFPILERQCEFPMVQPIQVGQPHRFTYFSLSPQSAALTELFRGLGRLDHHTGELMEVDMGPDRYPTEPIYAPDQDNLDQGWILTVVFDGTSETSEVWVLDGDRLDNEPVCRLGLPSVIPIGFHGTWAPA